MNESTPPESLYGDEPKLAPVKAPSLLDQLTGVFTEPQELFKRLAETPVWGGALALMTVLNGAVATLWALRVDVDAMLRPMLERNPKIPAESIDRIIEFQSKAMLPFALLGGLLMFGLICLLMALLYWIVAQWTSQDRRPTYAQAFSATAVSSLVLVPKTILLMIICGLKQIGGAKVEELSPTSLGFYVVPESLKLHALFNALDLFTFASLLMLFYATRHTMRLKTYGALICVAIAAAMMIGLPVLGAR